MSEPIRIRFCPNCNTGIQEGLAVCPECGAPQRREGSSPPPAPVEPGPAGRPEDGFGDLFGGGAMPTGRQATGSLARAFLGPNLGCLATGLVFLFGGALFVGLLLKEPMAVLGVLLLVVGSVGLVLTAMLVRLLWDARPPRRP